jgi:hypothetical protein
VKSRALATLAMAGFAASGQAAENKRDVNALKTMDSFGRCVGGKTLLASQLMAALPGSPEAEKITLRLSTADCLASGELRFKSQLLRGVVAEVLLKKGALGHFPRNAAIFPVPVGEAVAAEDPVQRTSIALIQFGQCVAAGNKAGVEKLFRTTRETKAEGAALAELRPSLNACLEHGATFKLDRFQMRSFLAEGAYRNAVQAQQGASNA